MMQWSAKITELNEKDPDCVLTECSLHCQVIGQITAIAVLHDEVNIVLRLFAVQQRHDIFMVKFRELFEYFNFLAEKILRFCQALLGDTFYGHG